MGADSPGTPLFFGNLYPASHRCIRCGLVPTRRAASPREYTPRLAHLSGDPSLMGRHPSVPTTLSGLALTRYRFFLKRGCQSNAQGSQQTTVQEPSKSIPRYSSSRIRLFISGAAWQVIVYVSSGLAATWTSLFSMPPSSQTYVILTGRQPPAGSL